MNHENAICTQCVPDGHREGAMTQHLALLRFQVHSSLNRFPAMCQQEDGAYFVCHSRELSERMSALAY